MAVRTVMGAFEQVCSKCKGPRGELYREKWGCDSPTQYEQTRIPCFACNDDTYGCPECEDRRWVPVYSCPKSMRDPYLEQVARVALWSREGGPLPEPGGSLEQAATFMDARDVVFSAAAEVEENEMKRQIKGTAKIDG